MGFFKRDLAGIYFGTQGVSIVETKGSDIANYNYALFPKDITKPSGVSSSGGSIFDIFLGNEVEITAFLQKVIRDSKIHTNEVVVALPTKDLIVRFFEIPPIPRREVDAGISFEIKKYIPFRTDEIAFDYQTRVNPKGIEVLFTGIKNEQLMKYVSIVSQLDLKVVAIEPSQFCLFRALRLKNVLLQKETALVIEIDGEEGVVSIADIGFPCFTRDIRLTSPLKEDNAELDALIFRLINEVRVSIDYFRRQFLKKGVDKIIILAKDPAPQLVDNFNKELGTPITLKAPEDLIGVKEQYSLDLTKAFGASLRIGKPFSLTIDLAKRIKTVSASEGEEGVGINKNVIASLGQQLTPAVLLEFFDLPKKDIIKYILIGLFFLVGVFIFFNVKVQPHLKELKSISQLAMEAPRDLLELSKEKLDKIRKSEKDRLSLLESNFVRDLLISEKFFALSDLIPEGVWLTDISFSRSNNALFFKGLVFKESEQDANDILYGFIDNLKQSSIFSNNLKRIELISVKSIHTRSKKDNKSYKVIQFEIGAHISF